MAMSVSDAVSTRRSVRAFLPDPVPLDLIKSVLDRARRAPSGGNLQPWHAVVLAGPPLERLVEAMTGIAARGLGSEPAQYSVYPDPVPQPFADRRLKVGEDMYARLAIPREDKPARAAWFANNFRFFGAPLALLIHMPALMGAPQWSDLGMWMQTVMLLLREEGLDSCSQESWSLFHTSLRTLVPIPDDHIIFAGMAIGYADQSHSVNGLKTDRAALNENVQWMTE